MTTEIANASTFKKFPRRVVSSLGWSRTAPLLLITPVELAESPLIELMESSLASVSSGKLKTKLAEQLESEFIRLSASHPDIATALIALTSASLLPQLEGRLAVANVQAIHTKLIEWSTLESIDPEMEPLVFLLLRLELPLILGIVTRDSNPAELQVLARQIEVFVEQTLDEEGWVENRIVRDFGSLLMSLARCIVTLKAMKIEIGESTVHRVEWMIRNWSRLRQANGALHFSDAIVASTKSVAKLLLRLTADKSDRRLLKSFLKSAPDKNVKTPKMLSDPSGYSDSRKIGVFRSNWSNRSPKLAIAALDTDIILEASEREMLISGKCLPQISRNGKVLRQEAEQFELICWNSDNDVDYLEWELPYSDGVRWQRQFAFDKRNGMLFLADNYLGADPARYDYSCQFPFATGVVAESQADSREIRLSKGKSLALVIPLSMGEWKTDRADDTLTTTETGFEVRQARLGRALNVALAIDLDRRRSSQPVTWRQLTVGEGLKPVPKDVAVAYRFQIGAKQWVAYRSLGVVGNRTFVGKNVFCDFFFGQFLEDGTVNTLVAVE